MKPSIWNTNIHLLPVLLFSLCSSALSGRCCSSARQCWSAWCTVASFTYWTTARSPWWAPNRGINSKGTSRWVETSGLSLADHALDSWSSGFTPRESLHQHNFKFTTNIWVYIMMVCWYVYYCYWYVEAWNSVFRYTASPRCLYLHCILICCMLTRANGHIISDIYFSTVSDRSNHSTHRGYLRGGLGSGYGEVPTSVWRVSHQAWEYRPYH